MMQFLLCICLVLVPGTLGQVTCPGLGDFTPDAPFTGWPDPTCPGNPSLELIYEMYNTNSGPGVMIEFNRDLVPSNFDSSLETIFIIHGWTNDEDSLWVGILATRLITVKNVNVVAVNWGGPGGSQNINYWESASTTRTVGAETAYVMENLIQSGGANDARMWCVGHSLGAHTCGHMGRRATDLGMTLERATGMDPAGPNFASNPDRTVGIYSDVADFVDIIHTDRTLGSTPEDGADPLTLGDQDFYVNDGHSQPGCATDTCSHLRAYQVFEDSVTNSCYDATQECDSSNAIPASCRDCLLLCPTMGYDAIESARGIFTVPAPNENPPYAIC